MFYLVIENAKNPLTEKFIKELHFNLKVGTSDDLKPCKKICLLEYRKI